MPEYVIRNEHGKYLAPSGSERTWIRDARKAQRFARYEYADRERCPENERVEKL